MTFLYSTGMPILYPVCCFSFFLTYWVDKYFFLNVYRTPPRFDIELMKTVRGLLKYAVIIHFLFGFYMISNTSILTYSGDFTFLKSFKDQVEKANQYVKESEYVGAERLVTTHCLIYLFGMVAITLIGIFLKLFKKPLASLYTCFCCMFKIKNKVFSNDIYEDLHVTDVKREYIKTKNELNDYESIIGNRSKALFIEDSKWSQHTTQALKDKLNYMKTYQTHFLTQTNRPVRQDSLENFDELFKEFKHKSNNRLTSLYSYDIKDNPTYIKCQKIEEKIRADYQKK